MPNVAEPSPPKAVPPSASKEATTPIPPKTAAASAVRLGRVVSVSGSKVAMLVDQAAASANPAEPGALQIGALVKMDTNESTVFGMVSGLRIPAPGQEAAQTEQRIVQMELVGETIAMNGHGRSAFRRGVSFAPVLGASVFATTQEDLKHVYARPEKASVQIGTIYQDQSLPAFVSIDDLLGKHFAILGTTGTGKSCAVAVILRAILSQHHSGHIVLLDLHNEYTGALADHAEILGHQSLELPYWMLNFEEISAIVVGTDVTNREADMAILKSAIAAAKNTMHRDSEIAGGVITADTPVPYRLSDVLRTIDGEAGRLDKPTDSAPYLRLKDSLSRLQGDKRFAFMFQGLTVRDNMAAILSRIFRVPVDGKPVTILDLSAVPSEILNVVVALLCRITFDFALWGDRRIPVLLVCEEAHHYVSSNANETFAPTQRALGRIAKEGRKYGVSLCLVSQRPSDLSVEILSQCNTIFAMRMGNQKDQEFVRGTLTEATLGLLDSLPTLRTAEAVAVGEGVSVPVRLCFDRLAEISQPHSGTVQFSEAWQSSPQGVDFVAAVVERWRHQRR
jgi:DNA helicase HerA-like ATPase